MLALIRTPNEIWADSSLYLRIYVLGLPFLFFYNIATGIFSALGDSKTPFIFLAFSSTANILVDILFVAVFQMGVAGAASKADQVSVLVNNAMMTAISNYVAQNFGAGKRERIRQRSTTIPICS